MTDNSIEITIPKEYYDRPEARAAFFCVDKTGYLANDVGEVKPLGGHVPDIGAILMFRDMTFLQLVEMEAACNSRAGLSWLAANHQLEKAEKDMVTIFSMAVGGTGFGTVAYLTLSNDEPSDSEMSTTDALGGAFAIAAACCVVGVVHTAIRAWDKIKSMNLFYTRAAIADVNAKGCLNEIKDRFPQQFSEIMRKLSPQ